MNRNFISLNAPSLQARRAPRRQFDRRCFARTAHAALIVATRKDEGTAKVANSAIDSAQLNLDYCSTIKALV